ncbi:hypothetical protein [Bradyrhizobium sp. USDA 10063]
MVKAWRDEQKDITKLPPDVVEFAETFAKTVWEIAYATSIEMQLQHGEPEPVPRKHGLTKEEIAENLKIPEGGRKKFFEMRRNHLRAVPENRLYDFVGGKYRLTTKRARTGLQEHALRATTTTSKLPKALEADALVSSLVFPRRSISADAQWPPRNSILRLDVKSPTGGRVSP